MLKKKPETFISIDTFYSKVAAAAVDAGASIVNDISAGSMDSKMIATVAELKVPCILMHMKGTPQTMQQNAIYENVTLEVLDHFISKTHELQKAASLTLLSIPVLDLQKPSIKILSY